MRVQQLCIPFCALNGVQNESKKIGVSHGAETVIQASKDVTARFTGHAYKNDLSHFKGVRGLAQVGSDMMLHFCCGRA